MLETCLQSMIVKEKSRVKFNINYAVIIANYCSLIFADNPDPIQDVHISSSTMSSLTVEWTPGYDGGAEQSFIVVYRIFPNGSFGEKETLSGISHKIHDLLSGTLYEIAIYSENVFGRSESKELIGRTRREYFFFVIDIHFVLYSKLSKVYYSILLFSR